LIKLELVALRLSSARLRGNRASPDEPDDIALGRYLWNIALAEALYPAVHLLEVCLRNALDGAIATFVGPEWYDDPRIIVDPRAREDIQTARKHIADGGHSTDRTRIIAALDLGFWAGLFNREYEQTPLPSRDRIALWPGVLALIGPCLPLGLRNRAAMSEFLGRVRIIRNRAYHHEPLWRGCPDRRGVAVPLSIDHARIVATIRFLSPEVGRLFDLVDRFGDVFDAGPERWIEAVCGPAALSGEDPPPS